MLDLIKGASTELLSYTRIKVNGATQMRAGLNQETVVAYADTMRHNKTFAPFPPIIVYFDGTDYWLADGFHRHKAAFQAFGSGCALTAEVRAGTRRDAILHAAGANAEHGLQRTPADKRRAVQTLLQDEEWRTWSNYKIAEACRVSEAFVRKIKGELGINTAHETQYIHPRTGQPTTMNTQKIGQATDALALDRRIQKLSTALIAAGWGILNAPPPSESCVMSHKTKDRFIFTRDDRQSLLDALSKAANAEQIYELRHSFDDADSAPTAANAASTTLDPAITETLDEAVRRATSTNAGKERWQALAATGADYWQILDLLKSTITSTGGTAGPGWHDIEWRRGPIIKISKGVGGPVVANLMSGRLVEAVRRAWAIPEVTGVRSSDDEGGEDEPVIGCYQAAITERGDGSPVCAGHAGGTEDSAGEAAARLTEPTTPIRETSRALLSGTAEDRRFLAKSLLNTINVVLDDLPVYSTLTGKFTEILPAERYLRLMRGELQHLIESLSPKRIG